MDLSEIVRQIRAAITMPPGSFSEEDRKEALKACDALRVSFETPMEYAMRIVFSPHQATVLRLGVDMGLFDAAAKVVANGSEGVSTEQLASETGADRLLVTRIMRLLASMSIFREVAKDAFQPTTLSNAYVSRSPLSAGIIHMTKDMIPLSHLPDFFSERGWKSPDDAYNGPFQYAVGTDMHVFDYLTTKPKLQQAFTTTMTLSHRRRGAPWYTYFPVNEKFSESSRSDILLVDVGGGTGGDLVAFRKAYPEVSGKLVLQDLPAVISAADLDALSATGIEAIPHDFFQPQPIKDARCYYFRTVLHDWPDTKVLEILGHVQEAMGPEGVLLLEEIVLPEEGVPLETAYADLIMMFSFASMERRVAHWEDLFSKIGLRLVKLWRPEGLGGAGTSLLEAVRDSEDSVKQEQKDA